LTRAIRSSISTMTTPQEIDANTLPQIVR
jgi:hypothetical protein